MESEGAAKPKTLPRSWAFHPAGKLHSEILSEYLGRKSQDPEQQETLFEATKAQFLAAGESPLAHLKWREQELLLLCLEIIGDVECELNPGHPYFTDSSAYAENHNDDDGPYIPPIKEPVSTRLQLEECAACWHLKTKKENKFEIPAGAKHKDDCDLPKSVQYYRWQRCNNDIKITDISAQSTASPKTKDTAKKWWDVRWEELDNTDLNKTEVTNKVLDWINEDKEMSTETREDMVINLESALGSAQRRTSKRHSEGYPLPLRISQRSKYKLERLAMIDPGIQGGDSAKYRLIRNSQ